MFKGTITVFPLFFFKFTIALAFIHLKTLPAYEVPDTMASAGNTIEENRHGHCPQYIPVGKTDKQNKATSKPQINQ